MIEIVYKEEKQEARGNESYFRLPKNIRQIGDCKGKQKIYVEDYVYTYLKKLSADASAQKAAVLLGQYNWADGVAYFFLKGALEITCMEISPDNLKFDEKVWKEVGDTMNQYFHDQSILGWFLSLPGELEENDERILKIHLNHFGGNDKVLFRMEPSEKEEAFYIYDSGALKKLGGFYIYYEKNDAMQNYMVDHNQNARVEDSAQVADQAVTDFRKIVGQKQEQQKQKKTGGRGLAYGITVCAAAAVLALGLNYMNKGAQTGEQETQANGAAVAVNGNASGSNDRTGGQSGIGSQNGAGSQDETGSQENGGETAGHSGTADGAGTAENNGNTGTGSGTTGVDGSGTNSDGTAGNGTGSDGAAGTGSDSSGAAGNGTDSDGTAGGGMDSAGTAGGGTDSAGTAGSGTESVGTAGNGAGSAGAAGSGTGTTETSGGSAAGEHGDDSTQATENKTGAAGGTTETSAKVLTEYTVQKGDSLSMISEKYYGTMSRVKDICAMNGITSEDVIYAGQKILLPK